MAEKNTHTVGLIGVGNMGSAIARGLVSDGSVFDVALYDVDHNAAQSLHDTLGGHLCNDIGALVALADVVILAVKPDVIVPLVRKHAAVLRIKPLVSIAAGVPIALIVEALGTDNVVRVMPNTPALVGQGMSVISTGSGCDADTGALVERIFSRLGRTMVLPEKLMDAVTALSGCGPAYAFTVIQAMADGGVKLGIPRDKAVILAAQTLLGAAAMVLETQKSPFDLRGMVTSPGGSTIEAVHVLERAGFSGILMDAVEAAAIKSAQLGGKKS